MRHRSLAVAAGLTFVLALSARAEFPFAADPNRCAISGNPPGCIPLPNEMNACNGDTWKDASPNVCTQDAAVNASPNEPFGVSGMSVAGALVGRGRARSSRIEHPRARGLCTRTDAVQIAARAGDPPLAGLLLLPAWHEADRCDHQAVQAR